MINNKMTLRELVIAHTNKPITDKKTYQQLTLGRLIDKSIYRYDHRLLEDLSNNGNKLAKDILKDPNYIKSQNIRICDIKNMVDLYTNEVTSYSVSLFGNIPNSDKKPYINTYKDFTPKLINKINRSNNDFKAIKDNLSGYTITKHVKGLRCVLFDDMVLDYNMNDIKNEHLQRSLNLIGLFFASMGVILDGRIYKENTSLNVIKDYCNTKDVTTMDHRASLITERDNNRQSFIDKYNNASLDELTRHEQGYKYYITDCYFYNEPDLTYIERITKLRKIISLYTTTNTTKILKNVNYEMIELLRYFVREPEYLTKDNNDYYGIEWRLIRGEQFLFNKDTNVYNDPKQDKLNTFILK